MCDLSILDVEYHSPPIFGPALSSVVNFKVYICFWMVNHFYFFICSMVDHDRGSKISEPKFGEKCVANGKSKHCS